MKMRAWVLVAVGLLFAADAPGGDVKDEKKLEGVWVAVQIESNGTPVAAQELASHKMTVKGKTLTLFVGDQGGLHSFTLDPTQKPKTIDLNDGKLKGIYELKGDTLKLCYTLTADAKRPTEFAAKQGSDTVFQVWKRSK